MKYSVDDNMVIRGLEKAMKNFDGVGTCLEFGVGSGSTFQRIFREIKNRYPESRYVGFDSWEGLPEETPGVWVPERHLPGKLRFEKRDVISVVNMLGLALDDRISFVDGWFKDTLTSELQSSITDLAFVNIDVDLHSSTTEALNFLLPLLRPGVVIYFDDWKDPDDKHDGKWGEHLAWEEFTQRNPEIEWRTLCVNDLNQRCIEILGESGERETLCEQHGLQ